jgi:type VI protein secretion system component VasK
VRSPVAATPLDLSAMRELANLSAQTAIRRHAQWKQGNVMRAKQFMAILGLLACGIAMWLHWRWGARPAVYYAVLAGLVVAGVWGLQYLVVGVRLLFARRRYIAWKREAAPQATASKAEEPTPGPESAVREG